MSRGSYLMLWTILMHLLGLALSYVYGETIPAWIGGKLPDWAGMRLAVFWLYSRPIALLPGSLQPAFLHHPGLTWLSLALFIQLCYLLRYLHSRAKKNDLGVPYSGNPGGPYWEDVQRRFKDYQEAAMRWKPSFVLRTPTWYYYKRQDSNQPDLFWRGHRLIIEKEMLKVGRVHELAPILARELMYYNCDEVALKDILAYYPDQFTLWQLLLHLLGFCIFLPVMCMLWFFWPRYWEKRILVADKFAYCLGQGHLLYLHIQTALQQEEQGKRKRQEVTCEMYELEEQLRTQQDDYSFSFTRETSNYGLPGDNNRNPGQRIDLQLMQLRQREQQLLLQEQQALEVRPMLEQRREQLAALLGSEQTWMELHGIAPPVQPGLWPPAQEPLRLQDRTNSNNPMS